MRLKRKSRCSRKPILAAGLEEHFVLEIILHNYGRLE